jgi:hypothetical protein
MPQAIDGARVNARVFAWLVVRLLAASLSLYETQPRTVMPFMGMIAHLAYPAWTMKPATFGFALHLASPTGTSLSAHRGSRVRQRTPNEAIKSTVDNNIRSFGWKLAPFHSPPATPQTFAVRMDTDIASAQP